MVPCDVISLLSQAVNTKPVLTHRLKLAITRALCLILSLFARFIKMVPSEVINLLSQAVNAMSVLTHRLKLAIT